MPPLLTATAVVLASTVAAWTAWRVARGDFRAGQHLPLDLCNLSALLSLGYVASGSPLLATWMVCFALPGGIVSILTPDLDERHDRITRLKYWIVHPGLVVFGTAAALTVPPAGGMAMLPRLWLLLIAYAAVIGIVNHRLGANYLFLRHKPRTASLLDWYGPWPVYVFPLTATVVATMMLVFLGWSHLWR
ncbi:MAG TPA: TIGR02206 family membrane protein [Longimicrobium sp.]|nr:TIGR02206 family membrane protein [Longimicrobium sp.]